MTPPRPDWPTLAPAPRQIPFGAWLGIRIGQSFAQAGFAFLLFSLFPIGAFLVHADIASLWRYDGELETATGRVTAVERTRAHRSGSRHRRGTPVQRIEFEFERGGERISGVSYGEVLPPELGTSVKVEMPVGQPQFARIEHLRSDLFGAETLLVLLFPAFGLAALALSQWHARSDLALARNGRSALGRTLEVDRRRVSARKRSYNVVYEFEAEGRTIRDDDVTQRESVYEDPRGLRILYDVRDPERHWVVDDASLPLVVDPLGRIQSPSPGQLALRFVLPGLFVVALIGWGLHTWLT
jgi:hypothetical protein